MTKTGLGLRGKNALVVGGGFGIGRETALLLGHAGANVAVADIDVDRAKAVVAELEGIGARAVAVTGDVTIETDAIRMVAATVDAFGGLDVVANIVGLAAWMDVLSLDEQSWDLDLRRNLTHHLYLGRAAARVMIDSGVAGALVMVASVSGVYGAPMHAAYGVAKAGLMDLVRTMSQEWAPHGIRVNAIAPDRIGTPRVLAAMQAAGVDFNAAAIDDGVPLRRGGTPDEIAGPLVFLLSDLASFVTGQTIIVDGGMRAVFPHSRASTAMPRRT
ncbi:MAG TPA: SDR family NAD(P)-dependent oxidoreductase [Amycolatopsis sp.]|nr:SDR family NAD(P)-dependent oxidoreductase [Amycolatopsis sp.]